jgi:gluconolactonase
MSFPAIAFRLALLLVLLPLTRIGGQPADEAKPEFRQLVPVGAAVEKLAGGFKFVEGPAWNPIQGFLVFSDIPARRIYRYDTAMGQAVVFRDPSGGANGNFYAADGTLYTCEHGGRRVSVQPGNGKVEVLVDRYQGKLFNSPNDIAVKRDGTVWFTDPTYGLAGRPQEQATNNVYCYDPKTHELRAVASDFEQPNGLCFSPDETHLYIADSGQPRYIRMFDVSADNRLSKSRVFCEIDQGVPDGIRCDSHGNVFSTSEAGIEIFNPAGEFLGKIPVPETPANLCFGGPGRNDLFITARTSLYHIKLTTSASGL